MSRNLHGWGYPEPYGAPLGPPGTRVACSFLACVCLFNTDVRSSLWNNGTRTQQLALLQHQGVFRPSAGTGITSLHKMGKYCALITVYIATAVGGGI